MCVFLQLVFLFDFPFPINTSTYMGLHVARSFDFSEFSITIFIFSTKCLATVLNLEFSSGNSCREWNQRKLEIGKGGSALDSVSAVVFSHAAGGDDYSETAVGFSVLVIVLIAISLFASSSFSSTS